MTDRFSDRKFIIGAIMVLPMMIFLVRLFILQVMDPSYRLSAESNVLRHVTQYPSRGLVYDRNGEILVYNEPVYDLMVIPAQLAPFDTAEFCAILDITREFVDAEIRKAREYSRFRSSIFLKQVSSVSYAVLQEKLHKFPGFYVQPRSLRKYPKGIAAHILGYVGEVDRRMIEQNPGYVMGDYIGITGLENTYEEELRGTKGVNIFLVDVHNRIVGPYQQGRFDVPAVVGNNVILALDARLQEYGEMLMQNKKGSIVAIEPSTGEILALVSSPTYHPDRLVGRVRSRNFRQLVTDTLQPLFNRALMANYPPGSIFKVINGAIGLQEGLIHSHSTHSCPGFYRVGGLTMRCRNHVSPLPLPTAIQVSCNTYFAHVFRNLLDHPKYGSVTNGYNVWRDHVRSFGLGDRLNTDFANELRGNVPPSTYYDRFYGENRWRSLQLVSMSIGQGELMVTPVQMANMTAAIANRGYYIPPHAMKEIENSQIDIEYRERKYTTIDSIWFEPIIEGMFRAVNGPDGGTARIAQVAGLDICGKTGTVQNPSGENHSTFIAFAPRDNPKIAIAVYVENAGYGSTWAAPIASLIIEKYLKGEIASNRKWIEKRMMDGDFINPPQRAAPVRQATAGTPATPSATGTVSTAGSASATGSPVREASPEDPPSPISRSAGTEGAQQGDRGSAGPGGVSREINDN
jgi:penicillin-binding protein 2